jgi:hypothetical protein
MLINFFVEWHSYQTYIFKRAQLYEIIAISLQYHYILLHFPTFSVKLEPQPRRNSYKRCVYYLIKCSCAYVKIVELKFKLYGKCVTLGWTTDYFLSLSWYEACVFSPTSKWWLVHERIHFLYSICGPLTSIYSPLWYKIFKYNFVTEESCTHNCLSTFRIFLIRGVHKCFQTRRRNHKILGVRNVKWI